MKKILLLTLLGIIFALLILLVVSELKAQTGQNTRRWDLWSGSWDWYCCYLDSTEQDTIWLTAQKADNDTFYTEQFKVWPFGSVDMFLGDTSSATDSFKTTVDFIQSGFDFAGTAAENFTIEKTLSWKSNTSKTEIDTLTASKYYSANITDEPIKTGRWGRYRIITYPDHKVLDGAYALIRNNSWNNFK